MMHVIGMILFWMLVVPAVVLTPLFYVYGMIQERCIFPFEDWYEPFIVFGVCLIWPVPTYVITQEYRLERKLKLEQISKSIELHYKDRWYD